jgi:hypothetical protein
VGGGSRPHLSAPISREEGDVSINGPGVQRTKRPDTAEEAAVGEEAAAGGGEAGGREPWGGVAGV